MSFLETLTLLQQKGVLGVRTLQRLKAAHSPKDERHPFVQLATQTLQTDTTPSYPLTLEVITRLVAEACNVPYYRIDPLKIDVEAVTGLVSQAYATRFQFLPVEVSDAQVVIASAEPYISEWEPEIAPILKRRIKRVLANPVDIERYLKEFYGVSRSIVRAASSKASERTSIVDNFEQLTQLGQVGEPDANDQHIVHLVDWLLQFAFEQRASDIHIEPRRDESNIRFRIDGVLHLVNQIATPVVGAIISRIKSLGRMDVADKRRPQDGRLKTKTPHGREIELRLSTMPTTFGEKLVMRIFDPDKLEQPFETLGFSPHDLENWHGMTSHSHGVILVTGPTGSGKTTTLYSALRQIARPEINVCTIEDPIEMVEPAFNQMQVQPAIDLDFAGGVRTLLRQDPDVIMVGEIRDRETANVAIQAALTGHLVLSTLHTNDAPSAITRLMDLGVEPYLIGATLLGAVAQRLVRTLCPHCRKPTRMDPKAWREFVLAYPLDPPKSVNEAVGCDECRHTGFRGREGLYEMLTVDDEMREMIRPHAQALILRRHALEHGMVPLRMAGALKVATGKTTLGEVISVVPPSDVDHPLPHVER
ncbi:MAG: type II/IV secretion system protein [Gammaproteobacteria bacterium]|nr:type II/IV secretion system protein [Gammaproteobacteria bacterium]MBI5617321.1 type II/IV secretion system protein [Gammaproteobacteria bacterium]